MAVAGDNLALRGIQIMADPVGGPDAATEAQIAEMAGQVLAMLMFSNLLEKQSELKQELEEDLE
jgi:hypothetical protein